MAFKKDKTIDMQIKDEQHIRNITDVALQRHLGKTPVGLIKTLLNQTNLKYHKYVSAFLA